MEKSHNVHGTWTAYPKNGAVTQDMAERWANRYRRIMNRMSNEIDLFGEDYRFKYNQSTNTLRADWVGKPVSWLNKWIWYDSLNFYDEIRFKDDKEYYKGIPREKRGTILQDIKNDIRKTVRDVFGIKFDQEGVAYGDAYFTALLFNLFSPLAKIMRQLSSIIWGDKHFDKAADGRSARDKIEASWFNTLERFKENHQTGYLSMLDENEVKKPTIVNIDLDAFSGTQQGKIMRFLSGEDDSIKEEDNLPKQVVEMLNRVVTLDGCGVILTANTPQALAVCVANARKIKTGRVAINASNGQFLYVAGDDRMLHQVKSKPINEHVMKSLSNFLSPGGAGNVPSSRWGALGGYNTSLFIDTPVKVQITNAEGQVRDVTLKIGWDVVVVDKDGKKHTMPILPPGYGVGPTATREEKEVLAGVIEKWNNLNKVGVQSVTFVPNKDCKDFSKLPEIVKVKKEPDLPDGSKRKTPAPLTDAEYEELLCQISQAGATAFLTTVAAEKTQLDTMYWGSTTDLMPDMQVLQRSDGGFSFISPGCSSFDGAVDVARNMGYSPDEMVNFMANYEFGGSPIKVGDVASRLSIADVTQARSEYNNMMTNNLVHTISQLNSNLIREFSSSGREITNRKTFILGDNKLTKVKFCNARASWLLTKTGRQPKYVRKTYNSKQISNQNRNKGLASRLISSLTRK